MDNYTQCDLITNEKQQTAWIPSKFAKLGQLIIIDKKEKWEVVGIYGTRSIQELDKQFATRKRFGSIDIENS